MAWPTPRPNPLASLHLLSRQISAPRTPSAPCTGTLCSPQLAICVLHRKDRGRYLLTARRPRAGTSEAHAVPESYIRLLHDGGSCLTPAQWISYAPSDLMRTLAHGSGLSCIRFHRLFSSPIRAHACAHTHPCLHAHLHTRHARRGRWPICIAEPGHIVSKRAGGPSPGPHAGRAPRRSHPQVMSGNRHI